MQFKNTTIKKIFIYLIFSSIFLLGISIYKDYGLTFDDDDYRINGEFYYEYIKILFDSDSTYSLSDFHLFAEDFFCHKIWHLTFEV